MQLSTLLAMLSLIGGPILGEIVGGAYCESERAVASARSSSGSSVTASIGALSLITMDAVFHWWTIAAKLMGKYSAEETAENSLCALIKLCASRKTKFDTTISLWLLGVWTVGGQV